MRITKHIPSSITALNLAIGFSAILLNDPFYSPLLIFACSFLDVFDGATARKLNATSPFGAELDSLADIVSFIVAPAYLYFHHVLYSSPDILGVISTGILVVFGGLRLAKYNIDTEQKSNFKGVPVPTTGLFFVFLVFEKHANTILNFEENTLLWLILPIIFAYLMVSPFNFFSLKKSESKKKKLLIVIMMVVFLSALSLSLITRMPFIPLALIIYILFSLLFCRKGC